MWVVYKKRKTNVISCKRKLYCDNSHDSIYTLHNINNEYKKQRTIYCIIHEDQYICNIYECNGIKNFYNYSFNTMPYIS